MKKISIIISLLLCVVFCQAQKINSCNYKNIDTLFKYKNAEIVIYKNKQGKQVADTIWYPLRCNINISYADVVNVDEDKKLKRHK